MAKQRLEREGVQAASEPAKPAQAPRGKSSPDFLFGSAAAVRIGASRQDAAIYTTLEENIQILLCSNRLKVLYLIGFL